MIFLLQIAQALQKAKVPYAVVGGYAVALQGALRGTVDVDIVLNLSKANYIAAEGVLKKLGLEPRLPITAEDVFNFREEYIKNRNLVAWSFSDPKQPLHQLDIIITHNLEELEIDTFRLHGVQVRVLSKKSLIKMKKLSGRPQDFEDIKALERLLNEE